MILLKKDRKPENGEEYLVSSPNNTKTIQLFQSFVPLSLIVLSIIVIANLAGFLYLYTQVNNEQDTSLNFKQDMRQFADDRLIILKAIDNLEKKLTELTSDKKRQGDDTENKLKEMVDPKKQLIEENISSQKLLTEKRISLEKQLIDENIDHQNQLREEKIDHQNQLREEKIDHQNQLREENIDHQNQLREENIGHQKQIIKENIDHRKQFIGENDDYRLQNISRTKRDATSDGNDELSVQLQDQNSDQTSDKSWLQLTSYARIPYNAIQEFCSRTRASCPPGPKGPNGDIGDRGLPGATGIRGDRGLPGIQGPRGPLGPTGIKGETGFNGRKGDTGHSGIPGLDGRDGLPGEPGLDGIPGRNGLDGIPGVDGIPGFDGLPGSDGINGSNGQPGYKGDKGVMGPIGSRGIAGPRGRLGKNGTPGTPGEPGIRTWMVNGTEAKRLLIAPSIPGAHRKRKTIVVREKDNLRLRCQAAGEPRPQVEWSREDGMAIATGQWKDVSVMSPTLNLTYIRRDHTGKYRCEAYNGIPPNDFKTFQVEVHFDPMVKVIPWKVGAYNGSTASLECQVEAYPVAVTYWEDRRGWILENSEKHRIFFKPDEKFQWKSYMSLRITNISKEDFGDYHCVAKNELSMTRGLIKVHEIDPNRYVPSTGSVNGLTFGPDPPNYSELFNDLCPPPVQCPDCPKEGKRVESRGSLYCLRVEQFGNDTYPGFRNRTLDCELSAIGKPVYHRHTDSPFGSWLRDPMPKNPQEVTRYWTATPQNLSLLFEYSDKNSYRNDRSSRNYTLPRPFQGNSHAMYNGSFYYQEKDRKNIIKYDIGSGAIKILTVPHLSFEDSNYLYDGSKDFLDLSTDENGLWAIYGLPENNNTVVMKIDPWDLKIEYSWNISLSHHKFGEMFISCGVLYGIESSTDRDTKIRFALDLYKKNILDVDLPFTNPFSNTTMLGYNPKTKEIYSWDSGNQLTYPVKFIDIGYNTPYDEKTQELKSKLQDYESDFEVGGFR